MFTVPVKRERSDSTNIITSLYFYHRCSCIVYSFYYCVGPSFSIIAFLYAVPETLIYEEVVLHRSLVKFLSETMCKSLVKWIIGLNRQLMSDARLNHVNGLSTSGQLVACFRGHPHWSNLLTRHTFSPTAGGSQSQTKTTSARGYSNLSGRSRNVLTSLTAIWGCTRYVARYSILYKRSSLESMVFSVVIRVH